ncbi:hypothetical protein TCAL_17432 [Tigriopus californicus]|uniref:Uncharacterized protein n=1 Tax=Tigriopus californicus TaxID=6832 RepID=A0A553NRZ9_TIGCA|nr:hypothetical protein TCAL_17432 [Tigriopus californicus]
MRESALHVGNSLPPWNAGMVENYETFNVLLNLQTQSSRTGRTRTGCRPIQPFTKVSVEEYQLLHLWAREQGSPLDALFSRVGHVPEKLAGNMSTLFSVLQMRPTLNRVINAT